jgi:cyclophilin family peptidyl-prolyl cis-trans isomerase
MEMPMRKSIQPLLLALLLAVSACTAPTQKPETVQVEMKTSLGTIRLALDRNEAPQTVDNFVQYVREGFYDGTIFHRVIKGFMIQGGGYSADMQKKATRAPINNEARNKLSNLRGSIAMARTSAPHSATAQFFINHQDNKQLDYPSFDGWGYAVFGKVTDGMSVVDAIAAQETGIYQSMRDVPKQTVLIESMRVIE